MQTNQQYICSSCHCAIYPQEVYKQHINCQYIICIWCINQYLKSYRIKYQQCLRSGTHKTQLMPCCQSKTLLDYIIVNYSDFLIRNCLLCGRQCKSQQKLMLDNQLHIGSQCYINLIKQFQPKYKQIQYTKFQSNMQQNKITKTMKRKCYQMLIKLTKIKCLKCQQFKIDKFLSSQLQRSDFTCLQCLRIKNKLNKLSYKSRQCYKCHSKQCLTQSSNKNQIILLLTNYLDNIYCFYCLFKMYQEFQNQYSNIKQLSEQQKFQYYQKKIKWQTLFEKNCLLCGRQQFPKLQLRYGILAQFIGIYIFWCNKCCLSLSKNYTIITRVAQWVNLIKKIKKQRKIDKVFSQFFQEDFIQQQTEFIKQLTLLKVQAKYNADQLQALSLKQNKLQKQKIKLTSNSKESTNNLKMTTTNLQKKTQQKYFNSKNQLNPITSTQNQIRKVIKQKNNLKKPFFETKSQTIQKKQDNKLSFKSPNDFRLKSENQYLAPLITQVNSQKNSSISDKGINKNKVLSSKSPKTNINTLKNNRKQINTLNSILSPAAFEKNTSDKHLQAQSLYTQSNVQLRVKKVIQNNGSQKPLIKSKSSIEMIKNKFQNKHQNKQSNIKKQKIKSPQIKQTSISIKEQNDKRLKTQKSPLYNKKIDEYKGDISPVRLQTKSQLIKKSINKQVIKSKILIKQNRGLRNEQQRLLQNKSACKVQSCELCIQSLQSSKVSINSYNELNNNSKQVQNDKQKNPQISQFNSKSLLNKQDKIQIKQMNISSYNNDNRNMKYNIIKEGQRQQLQYIPLIKYDKIVTIDDEQNTKQMRQYKLQIQNLYKIYPQLKMQPLSILNEINGYQINNFSQSNNKNNKLQSKQQINKKQQFISYNNKQISINKLKIKQQKCKSNKCNNTQILLNLGLMCQQCFIQYLIHPNQSNPNQITDKQLININDLQMINK